jgi:hypothetical protein
MQRNRNIQPTTRSKSIEKDTKMVKMINEKIRKTFATSVFYMLRRQRKYKHARKNMMV